MHPLRKHAIDARLARDRLPKIEGLLEKGLVPTTWVHEIRFLINQAPMNRRPSLFTKDDIRKIDALYDHHFAGRDP